MDDRPRGFGRGTELGLQVAPLAFACPGVMGVLGALGGWSVDRQSEGGVVRQSESGLKTPSAWQLSQIDFAVSRSPSGIGVSRSG